MDKNLTSKRRILARLQSERELLTLKRKIHKLRLAVLGDMSPFEDEAIAQEDPSEGKRSAKRKGLEELYDVMTLDFAVGQSNELLKNLRNMVGKTSVRMPEVEFEDVHPMVATLNSLYLQRMFTQCNASDHMRKALLDYLIGGLGWTWDTLVEDRPGVKFVDCLDMIWDTTVELITDSRWRAVRVRRRLADWIVEFGEAPFADILEKQPKDERGRWEDDCFLDQVTELIYYFDIDNVVGTMAVVREDKRDGDPDDEHAFVEGPEVNAHYTEGDGYRRAFHCLNPCYQLQVPSATHPQSMVELMLPHQIQLRIAENYREAVQLRGRPWFDMEENSYDDDQEDSLLEGQVGTVVKRKSGKEPMKAQAGLDMPQHVLDSEATARRQLAIYSGVNAYADGQPIPGTRNTQEVQAMRGESGVVSQMVAKDHADHWRRAAKHVLANARYDESPLTLRYDKTTLRFDQTDPIFPLLDPDAEPVVSEDSMMYRSPEEEMAFLLPLKREFETPAAMAAAPGGVATILEKIARSARFRDMGAFFSGAAPMMTAGGQEGPNQAATAAASTQ